MARLLMTWWSVLLLLVVEDGKMAAGQCSGCDVDETSAYCWDLHLDALPDCLPDSLTYLDVYRSSLGAVTTMTLQRLQHLEILYLDANELELLEPGALENLTQISAAGNGLVSVPEDLFAGNVQLRLVDLSSNRLAALRARTFQGLERLEQLYLQDNGLQLLEGDFLPARLRRIDLSGNLLASLEPALFSRTRDALVGLHGNPWLCDCRTTAILDSFSGSNVTLVADPSCAQPPELAGLLWSQVGDLCTNTQ